MSSGTLLSIKEGDFLMTKKRRVQVSFTEQQIEQLERLSKEKGFTKSAILALALEEYWKSGKVIKSIKIGNVYDDDDDKDLPF